MILIDASNFHFGDGVQLAASFISEAFDQSASKDGVVVYASEAVSNNMTCKSFFDLRPRID